MLRRSRDQLASSLQPASSSSQVKRGQAGQVPPGTVQFTQKILKQRKRLEEPQVSDDQKNLRVVRK